MAKKVLKKTSKKTFDKDKTLQEILIKKAKGFVLEEVIEEYFVEDGKMNLQKRKVTTKEVAPDLTAIKALIEIENLEKDKFSNMTTEELKTETIKLLDLLKGEEGEN